MEAVGQTYSMPEAGSVICSKHSLNGVGQDNNMKIPCYVKMCRICFAEDCNMYSMTAFGVLNEAYETLTSVMTADEEHLPRYLCIECAERLMNCARFRRRSLRAHSMLLDIARRHGHITVELARSVIEKDKLNSDTIHNQNDDHFGSNDECLEGVNKLTDGQCDMRRENVNMCGNIYDSKLEIDNAIDHRTINVQGETNDVAVTGIKMENDDLNNQEELNTRSSNLDEDIVVPDVAADDCDIKQDNVESLCNSDEDIVVDDIISQNDMINRDDVSVCSFNSEDIDVDVVTVDNEVNINQDVSDKVTSNQSLVYSARLYEDIISYVLKIEYNDMKDQYSSEEKPFIDCKEYRHSFLFVGEDVLGDCLPLQEVRQEAERGTDISQDLNEMRIDNQQPPEADGGLSTDDTFRCDICPYQTDIDIQLLEHLKTHAYYYCDMCIYKTLVKRNLIHHIKAHSGKKPYSRDLYEKRHSIKSSSEPHMKKCFVKLTVLCSICHKSLENKSALDRHLRVHTGEKPYACDICKKKFARKSNLLLHLRTHTGEKPFSCRICKKKFSRNYNLIEHMDVHSDKKPYSCAFCNKNYQKSTYRSHMKRHSCHKLTS